MQSKVLAECAVPKVIKTDDYEIEAGFIVRDGTFRATVVVRTNVAGGSVSEVGYVFAENFSADRAAINAAQRYATIASLHPERLIAAANSEFTLQ